MNRTPIEEERQPGLQVAAPIGPDKQSAVDVSHGNEESCHEKDLYPPSEVYTHNALEPSHERIKFFPRSAKRTILFGALSLVLLALALGLGLGLGLTHDSGTSGGQSSAPLSTSASPPSRPADNGLKIGSSLNASYTSTDGVWNGTAITSSYQRFGPGLENIPSDGFTWVIYYQHHSGELRWVWMGRDGSWQRGPAELETLARDARNSTPIAAFNPTIDSINYWNIFCRSRLALPDDGLDANVQPRYRFREPYTANRIRHRIGNSKVSGWVDGSINEKNLTVLDGDLVGLQVCNAADARNLSSSIRLFYASASTTLTEYMWDPEEDVWTLQGTWEGYSGAAGIGCFNGPGWRNLALVNDRNRLEFWYEDQPINGIDRNPGWKKGMSMLSLCRASSTDVFSNSKRGLVQRSPCFVHKDPPRVCHHANGRRPNCCLEHDLERKRNKSRQYNRCQQHAKRHTWD